MRIQNQILKFEYEKGVQKVQPCNDLVKSWVFKEDEHDEATLAHVMGEIAQKNGLSANDMRHLYPYVLRMLKSDIAWAQNTKER